MLYFYHFQTRSPKNLRWKEKGMRDRRQTGKYQVSYYLPYFLTSNPGMDSVIRSMWLVS